MNISRSADPLLSRYLQITQEPGNDRFIVCKPMKNHLHRNKLRLVRDASIEVGLKCFLFGSVRDVHYSKVIGMLTGKSVKIRRTGLSDVMLEGLGCSTKVVKNKI